MKITHLLTMTFGLAVLGLTSAQAGRGDLFLTVSALSDPFLLDEPSLGGQLGLEMGVNDRTDFFAAASLSPSLKSFSEDGPQTYRLLLGSWFSPYFGEIRPRIGGYAGYAIIGVPQTKNVASFNVGMALQGLWQVNDGMALAATISPNLLLGSSEDIESNFSLPIALSLQFRLGK
jgi:hypothetical protein